jgi:hypothetical protein
VKTCAGTESVMNSTEPSDEGLSVEASWLSSSTPYASPVTGVS